MAARSRNAVSSEMKPPSVKSGPGANCGKNMAATGPANIAKPTPPTPCAIAAPNTTAAMVAYCRRSGYGREDGMPGVVFTMYTIVYPGFFRIS